MLGFVSDTTMQAIVQTGKETIEIQDPPEPEPAADEVLIRVHHAGLCGSDVHAYEYSEGFEWVKIPRVMGHEYTGKVVAVGKSVDDIAVGDTVVEEPIHPCGSCFQCKSGEWNVCQDTTLVGMETDGAYREYTTVSAEHVHTAPDTVSSKQLAITEPLSVATRAVYERSDVTPGDNVLVEGPGPIGALIAAVGNVVGANVTVSGIDKDSTYRLPLLAEMGVDTVDVSSTPLTDVADAATDGLGFDAVFDSTGHKSGIPTGVDVVRKGGNLVVVGLPDGASDLRFTPVVRGEIDIISSYGALWTDFERSMQLLESGRLNLSWIVDTGYSITDPQEAIDDFRAGQTIKPIFDFT